jgi:hypothetical protein
LSTPAQTSPIAPCRTITRAVMPVRAPRGVECSTTVRIIHPGRTASALRKSPGQCHLSLVSGRRVTF